MRLWNVPQASARQQKAAIVCDCTKTADVDPADSISEKTAKKMDQYIMVMLVIVAGVATLETLCFGSHKPSGFKDFLDGAG